MVGTRDATRLVPDKTHGHRAGEGTTRSAGAGPQTPRTTTTPTTVQASESTDAGGLRTVRANTGPDRDEEGDATMSNAVTTAAGGGGSGGGENTVDGEAGGVERPTEL